MIQATIDTCGFTIRGHADYAEHGKDIVCSAVSALTQTIAIILKRECNAFVVNNEGLLFVSFDNYQIKEKLLLSTLIEGLNNVKSDYPNHIELNIQKGMI